VSDPTLAAVAAIAEPSLAPSVMPAAQAAAPEGAQGFGSLVAQGLGQINEQLVASQVDLQQLAAGAPVSMHQVMIGLEESRMSFQLMMQVRNRLLEGYQELMRMQV
jgi:flagellar hook-basal body complex protein FliE